MKIKSAKYHKNNGNNICISVEYGEKGERLIAPLVEDNTDYIEIMRQVDAGELTIEPADEPPPADE